MILRQSAWQALSNINIIAQQDSTNCNPIIYYTFSLISRLLWLWLTITSTVEYHCSVIAQYSQHRSRWMGSTPCCRHTMQQLRRRRNNRGSRQRCKMKAQSSYQHLSCTVHSVHCVQIDNCWGPLLALKSASQPKSIQLRCPPSIALCLLAIFYILDFLFYSLPTEWL